MARNIFIWVGHPAENSFNAALAERYAAGAWDAGAQVRQMNLFDMNFESDTYQGYAAARPELEPDLLEWQDSIRWADHFTVIHPYWWGAMPGRAKAVFDRALSPGFAFKYHGKGLGWDKLMTGRTADAIITSDTPPLLDTWLYRRPGRNVITNQVFKFCGFKPRKVEQIGSIKTASDKKRADWLDHAEMLGRQAARL